MSGTGFYGSNDPTNNVKALKEAPKDQASIPTGPPHCVTAHIQYDKITQKHSRHGEMGHARQKSQNPIQRTVRTAYLSVLMTVHNFQYTIQHRQF